MEFLIKKSKLIVSFSRVLLTAAALLIALAACSNPSGDDGKAFFTINLGSSGRMAWGPSNSVSSFPAYSDLKYELTFTSTINQNTETFEGNLSSGTITGSIDIGEYTVSLKIFLEADGTPYASDDGQHGSVEINANTPISMNMVKDPDLGEDGSAAHPFRVYDLDTLRRVGKGSNAAWTGNWSLSAHYSQMRDITLPDVEPGEFNNWTPIGEGTPFAGSYDGNNKTISNLTQGFFQNINSGAIVQNVGIIDCDINGGYWSGSVVGTNEGTVKNCYATGEIRGQTNDSSVGGVVGFNNGMVQNCHFMGEVSGVGILGGVVGNNRIMAATVQDCYATGKVRETTIDNSTVGGVVGFNCGTVVNCYSTSDLEGSINVGGVVGSIGTEGISPGTVQNCYSTGEVTGTNNVGGVVGNNDGGTVENCYATGEVSGTQYVGGVAGNSGGTVENCYATGNVSGTGHSVGGVAGNSGGTVENCYATGEVSGSSYVGGVVGGNSSGSVQNCIALNPKISGSDNWRVAPVGTVTNNYGREDMLPGGSGGWTNSAGEDGADITPEHWQTPHWWTDNALFNEGVWTIVSNKLPTLKGVPNEADQTPSVQSN